MESDSEIKLLFILVHRCGHSKETYSLISKRMKDKYKYSSISYDLRHHGEYNKLNNHEHNYISNISSEVLENDLLE